MEVSYATTNKQIGNRQQGRVETLCGGVVCNYKQTDRQQLTGKGGDALWRRCMQLETNR